MKKIFDILSDIKYGYIDKDNIIHYEFDENFSKNYKLQSPEELLTSKAGICWDQVELERSLFLKDNIKFKTYFIVYYDNEKCSTHTFLIYQDNKKFIWFEHSWKSYEGLHEYNSEKEALYDIKEKFITDGEINDTDNVCIYEYLQPKYGITTTEFFKHCESGKKLF